MHAGQRSAAAPSLSLTHIMAFPPNQPHETHKGPRYMSGFPHLPPTGTVREPVGQGGERRHVAAPLVGAVGVGWLGGVQMRTFPSFSNMLHMIIPYHRNSARNASLHIKYQ